MARKKPHPHLLDDPEVRGLLQREAAIAIRLRHPNVVRLRSIDLEDDAPVLVMDYVDGATLAELVRDWSRGGRTDTARAAIRIVLDAALGLDALHDLKDERGDPLALVHRDVSPQNILVGIDGHARVSDFGLTKCLANDRERATTEGILKGKAGYLAPEYIRGARGDRRQDIFSLGIVAWEALTRSRLFRGENDAQTLDRVLTMPIPSVAERAPELAAAAPAIDAVLVRALTREPEDRYATAAEFGAALAEAAERVSLEGSAADVTVGFSVERLAALADRRRSVGAGSSSPRRIRGAAAALAATAILVGVSVVAWWGLHPAARGDAPASALASTSKTPDSAEHRVPNGPVNAATVAPTEPATLAVSSASAETPSWDVRSLPSAAPAASANVRNARKSSKQWARPVSSEPTSPRPNPY